MRIFKLFSSLFSAHSGRGMRQRGFTLLEFMVVTLLISLLLAATVIEFGQANTRRINTQAVIDLKTVINHIRMEYDPVSKYNGVDEVQVATSAHFPARLCKNGNCMSGIYSPAFGDILAIAPVSAGAAFFVELSNISAEDCVAISEKLIYDVDEIFVSSMSGGGAVTRAAVLASTLPARDFFYYVPPSGTGICKDATNNTMFFYVGYP